ncbi:hypothetical protein LSH36_581g00010 [Paralvinella palmiformis]|uniref:Neurotransmitter-gated ion-channel ligand-binding domain-containing protein n=1 Tax=Paralvinella palmiformis TaxID=53620 RepID=A0AAD9MWN0_9ANNE|nr:hypothetical protein LSH36_581g00010 [Paralvinella palmiformis]
MASEFEIMDIMEQRKTDVYIRVVFIRIREINTAKETFAAKALVEAQWRETKLDGLEIELQHGEDQKLTKWADYWNPLLYVSNCVEEPEESISYQMHYDNFGSAYIVQKRRMKGTFIEKMNLSSYPFDTQILIGILIFATFAVDIERIQNRLLLSFILLLSNITFKFNISQTLPKVSYLTLLDKYVIVQIGIMCLVCLWHTTVFLVYDNHDQSLASYCDKFGFGILLGLYALFQFTFFLHALYLIMKKERFFQDKDEVPKNSVTKF